MRMFVALVPPTTTVEHLEEFLAPRREAGPDLRWTVPEQWHVTLAFIAHAAELQVEELVERLGVAAARRTPMEMAVSGGGAFPDPARAKVLFAGVDTGDGGDELDRLARGVRNAVATTGIEVEGGRFHPHLTVARSGRPFEATRWIRILDAYRGPAWAGETITLIASHLGEGPRRRPRYEILASVPLG
jgi:2'-5' RNA ligase